MQTEAITIDRKEARDLFRAYKKHRHYSEPIDREIARAYQLLAQGRLIIRAIESIKAAGLKPDGMPKLALAPATAKACHIRRMRSGALRMSPDGNFWKARKNDLRFDTGTFDFPVDSFSTYRVGDTTYRRNEDDHQAIVPPIPLHLRPRRGLANYHVLWEAEWTPVPPADPYLLRRIGKSDMWLVVAMWDLTPVERAALATRLTNA